MIEYRLYNPFEDRQIVADIWQSLLQRSPHSFFTSWGWVSTWLDSLPPTTQVRLIVGYAEARPVLALFAGQHRRWHYRFLPTRLLTLNATGNPFFDILYIEYNSFLYDPNYPFRPEELFGFLAELQWDEFLLPGILPDLCDQARRLEDASQHHIRLIIDETKPTHMVDLEQIRAVDLDYGRLLSKNKRQQIRQSLRRYEQGGTIHLRQAASAEEALEMLNGLIQFNQQRWQRNNTRSAFSNPYFDRFHRELISRRFEHGEIQMLHIYTDEMTIGYLYNLVYQGSVLCYQNGLNYSFNDNTYRPGLVSDFLAIVHNAEQGQKWYNFLAGEEHNKQSLATDVHPMIWARLIHGKARLHLERLASHYREWRQSRVHSVIHKQR